MMFTIKNKNGQYFKLVSLWVGEWVDSLEDASKWKRRSTAEKRIETIEEYWGKPYEDKMRYWNGDPRYTEGFVLKEAGSVKKKFRKLVFDAPYTSIDFEYYNMQMVVEEIAVSFAVA